MTHTMLTVHLHKEWREQRLFLGITIATMTVLALGVGLFTPADMVPEDVQVWFVIVGLAAALVGLAGDLIPGESRRGQLDFLRRSPGALPVSFAAKTIVLGIALTSLFAAAWLLGGLCLAIAGDVQETRARMFPNAGIAILWIGGAIAVTVPWIFATSCWLPRSASVVPATAITLAVVTAPPILVVGAYSAPADGIDVTLAATLLLAGGAVAAFGSYVRGLRFSRGRALLHGLVAVPFVVPLWGWSIERAYAWHHFDAGDTSTVIGQAVLGEGGGTAFVNVNRRWSQQTGPMYALAIDMETGDYRQLGAVQGHLMGVGILRGCEFLTGLWSPQRLVLRRQLDRRAQRETDWQVLDGRTGAVLARGEERTVPDTLRDTLNASSRATTPFRMPDGSRAWFEDRTTVIETADGERTRVPWPDGLRPGLAAGFGFHWLDGNGRTNRLMDLSRRRTLPTRGTVRFVRAGLWVVPTQTADRWGQETFDPDTGEAGPLPLEAGERIEAMAGDGRLLVTDADRKPLLLDPDSGARTPVTLDHPGTLVAIHQADWRTFWTPTRTPGGGDVFLVRFDDEQEREWATLARRDGDVLRTCVLSRTVPRVVAVPDDDHVIVVSADRSLERWTFGSGQAEVLFGVGLAAR